MIHRLPVTVYYEDTDLAGIVYYANYLKYIERGRTEMVREAGISQTAMKAEGLVFAVRALQAEYLRPARFEDRLIVETRLAELGGARFGMDQAVIRDGDTLFTAQVEIVCLTETGRPARLPADIRAKMLALRD